MSRVVESLSNGPETGVTAINVSPTFPRPWGFWSTLGFGIIGIALAREGPYALPYCIEYCVRFWNWVHPGQMVSWHRGAWWALATSSLGGFLLIGASVAAAWASGRPIRQYLGLAWPPRSDLILGLAILATLVVAEMAGTGWYYLHMPSTSPVAHGLFSGGTAATLLLLWPGGVIVAPVSEELMFRGFLFRGWEKTWLGATGTIVLTAALWALLHTNKNWLGVAFVFVTGLFLGWMRYRSGSTILTILLHAATNFTMAVLATIAAIRWIT